MGKTGIAPVVSRRAVDLLVLAEHHAARERGVRLRQSRGDRRLGPTTQAVERTSDPTAACAGEPDTLDHQLGGDTAPAQVGGEVEARAGILGGKAQAAGQRELVADRGAPGKRARAAAVEAQQHSNARERAAGDAGLGRGPERRGPRASDQVCPNRDRPAVVDQARGVVECFEAGGPDRRARQEQGGREDREHGRAGAGQAAEQGSGRCEAERGLGWGEREPGSERADCDVPWPTRQPTHSCSASRSVASRFSPIPSTCASSASERKAPCASRYSTMR